MCCLFHLGNEFDPGLVHNSKQGNLISKIFSDVHIMKNKIKQTFCIYISFESFKVLATFQWYVFRQSDVLAHSQGILLCCTVTKKKTTTTVWSRLFARTVLYWWEIVTWWSVDPQWKCLHVQSVLTSTQPLTFFSDQTLSTGWKVSRSRRNILGIDSYQLKQNSKKKKHYIIII